MAGLDWVMPCRTFEPHERASQENSKLAEDNLAKTSGCCVLIVVLMLSFEKYDQPSTVCRIFKAELQTQTGRKSDVKGPIDARDRTIGQ